MYLYVFFFLLWVVVVWRCVFLVLRLYVLAVSLFDVCERGSVCVSNLSELLVVIAMSIGCSGGVLVVCVFRDVRFTILAPG